MEIRGKEKKKITRTGKQNYSKVFVKTEEFGIRMSQGLVTIDLMGYEYRRMSL
jgi:hypothetical protein